MPNILEGYHNLSEAATFFLYTAFDHAEEALRLEIASDIFEKKINEIEVPDDWEVPEIPSNKLDLLDYDEKIIPTRTKQQLAQAWAKSEEEARYSSKKLNKNDVAHTVSIAGHVTNLHSCVEAVINKYLFIENEEETLGNDIYNSLDFTGVPVKISFLMREEIENNELQLGSFKRLGSLRNKAVHYKPGHRSQLSIKVKELFDIWREVEKLVEMVPGDPTGDQVDKLRDMILSNHVDW